MRICIVTSIFPPEIGGPSTYVYGLAKRICKKHEIHVVTYGKPEYEEIKGLSGSFYIHRVPYPSLPKILALPLRMLKLAFLALEIVRRYNCNVIFTQDPSIAGIPAYFSSKLTKKPLVMKFVGDWAWETAFSRGWTDKFLHDFYDEDPNLITKLMKKIQRVIGRGCKAIIVPSHYLKTILERWNIKTPIYVIPNAVNTYECDKESMRKKLGLKRKILISVGRLVPWKGFDKVINIMPELNKEFELEYLVIGEGPYKDKLKDLTRKLGLGNIKFIQGIPGKEVRKYICASDVFILPSLYEGMSHVILEAMASKTPVIASNVCGNPEIIKDRETGLLIDPMDRMDIRESIEKIFIHAQLAEKMVEDAYSLVVTNNSWDGHVKELENILNGQVSV